MFQPKVKLEIFCLPFMTEEIKKMIIIYFYKSIWKTLLTGEVSRPGEDIWHHPPAVGMSLGNWESTLYKASVTLQYPVGSQLERYIEYSVQFQDDAQIL